MKVRPATSRAEEVITFPIGSTGDLYKKVLDHILEAEKVACQQITENHLSLIEHRILENKHDENIVKHYDDLRREILDQGTV